PVFISSYALLDADGHVVLSTEKSEIGRDESNRDYFQKTYQSGLPSLSVWYSEKSLYFSAPVRNENEAVVGVLRARYDAAFLQQLITQHSGLGAQEAYAVLLDEHHIILAHSLYPQTIFKSLVPLEVTLLQQWQAEGRFPPGEPTTLSINLPEVEEKLAQIREETFFEVTDVQGIRQQAAAATMKERPWTVVFIQPRSVFITPINQQIRRSILMAIGVIFLAAYASLGLSRLITTPLSQLTESARRIAAGELDIQAEVTSRDEIGALAQAFNEMTSQLRDMIASLEERVAERTRDLEERSAYLQAAAEIGRAVAATLDPESLVQQAVDLMKERFGLYYVGLFELDGTGEWANLRAGTGKEGQAMIARRHRIRVGSGMIGWCIANRQPRIAQQAELDDVRLRPPELPKTRAEAALPLRARGEVLGALTIQSDQPGFFTPDNLAIFQIIADQIAVALENARLFAESQAALSSLERITLERARRGWQERLLRAGQAIAVRADGHSTLPAPPVLDENVRRALERGEITAEVDEQTPGGNYLLNVPIKVRGTTIGVLRTYKPAERGTWTEAEVQALSAIAERLALSLESARLFEETVRRAEREHLVTEITTRIRSTTDPQEMIRIAIEELKQALGVSHVRITPQRLSPAITETPSSDGNSPQE
ncbi:MAG: GAF domain-containing protein, partial [Anaerolineae bacterium]